MQAAEDGSVSFMYDASLNDPLGPCIVMEYIKGVNFGKATSTTSYPRPRPGIDGGRTYFVAFGVKF